MLCSEHNKGSFTFASFATAFRLPPKVGFAVPNAVKDPYLSWYKEQPLFLFLIAYSLITNH